MTLRLLDKKALKAKGVPFSNPHLLALEARGLFPRRLYLGETGKGRVMWVESEVDDWMRTRIAERDSGQAA